MEKTATANTKEKTVTTEAGTYREGDGAWCWLHGEFCPVIIAEITDGGSVWVYNRLVGEDEIDPEELRPSEADW